MTKKPRFYFPGELSWQENLLIIVDGYSGKMQLYLDRPDKSMIETQSTMRVHRGYGLSVPALRATKSLKMTKDGIDQINLNPYAKARFSNPVIKCATSSHHSS